VQYTCRLADFPADAYPNFDRVAATSEFVQQLDKIRPQSLFLEKAVQVGQISMDNITGEHQTNLEIQAVRNTDLT